MREALRFFVTWCLFLYLYVDEGTPGKGMLPVRKECRLTAGCGSSALRCQPEGGDM